jgi:hypothetical protein
MPGTNPPHVGFFPALPLARTLDLGDWLVGLPSPDVPWRTDRLRELTQTLMASFSDSGFDNGALVWHRERGFDGTLPPDEARAAIAAAVGFAVLDTNDRLDDLNKGHFLATTENAALYFQPIDEETGDVAHVRSGALKEIVSFGHKIGQGPLPLPEATSPIRRPVRASSSLARSVFDTMTTRQDEAAGRLRAALEWHRITMANSPAISLGQRLVASKTGFEALFGESKAWNCAKALNDLFLQATAPHRAFLPWTGVLWSPTDRTDVRPTNPDCPAEHRATPRSEIQDWFMNLAYARNAIIHEGALRMGSYTALPERPLSRYAGPLFWKGERMLREASKASLGPEVLLAVPLARFAAWKPVIEHIRSQLAEAEMSIPASQCADPHGDDVPATLSLHGPLCSFSRNFGALLPTTFNLRRQRVDVVLILRRQESTLPRCSTNGVLSSRGSRS